jgi:predicted ribosome quality control (RQC) complex YloA/Tae2 family protein
MGKTRFTSLDVRCLVRDIKTKIVGLRVANVYDLNNRTYLFKLAKPDQKIFLLIESGIRIHTTKFAREKKEVPSVFALKVCFFYFLTKFQTFEKQEDQMI